MKSSSLHLFSILLGVFLVSAFAQDCGVNFSYQLKSTYTFQNKEYANYTFTIKNPAGNCKITGVSIFGGGQISIQAYTNIQVQPGGPYFSIQGFGNALKAGQSYSGAGFVILHNTSLPFNGDPQLQVHATSCSACGPSTSDMPALDIAVFTQTGSFSEPPSAKITVPTYFKLIAGGFYGGNSTGGYVGSTSYPSSLNTWTVQARGHTADQGPSIVTVYAVAIFDWFDQFETKIFHSQTVGAFNSSGTASVVVPSEYTLTGGGAKTDEFLIENRPNTIRGDATSASTWTASFALDAGRSGYSVDGITTYAIGLRSKVAGYKVGNVISSSAGYTSSSAQFGSSFSSTALPLTPGSELVGGGYLASNAQVLSTYPSSMKEWTSIAQSTSSSSAASVVSYNVGLSVYATSTTPTTTGTSTTTGGGGSACRSIVISQTKSNSWSTGSQWTVTVTNSGSHPITAINLFAADFSSITNIWNVKDNSNGHYSFPDYVTALAAGGKIEFGYVASRTTKVSFAVRSCSSS